LLQAKAESDRKNYAAKHQLLRQLLAQIPQSFQIDSENDGIVGLTHNSGFRIHAPRNILPPEFTAVPTLVRERMKAALDMQDKIRAAVKDLDAMPGYGSVWWHPEEKKCWIVLGDSDEQPTHEAWQNAVKAIPGVKEVRSEAEIAPPSDDRENWIHVKRGSIFGLPYEWAGKLTGGPAPLSNAIVNSLLGGTAGYLGGRLATALIPDDVADHRRLPRLGALLGAGAGLLGPMNAAHTNAQLSAASGRPLGWRAITTPNAAVPINDDAAAPYENLEQAWKTAALSRLQKVLADTPIDTRYQKAAASYDTGFAPDLPPVPVDAFNNAIWNDVHMGIASARANPYGTKSVWGDNTQPLHTPPPIGAAATGLVSGIQEMYGGAGLLSPTHFIRGLAAAGVDGATARVAGGVLGVLGGLRPDAQRELQRAGVWSGLIRGVTGSVLGLY
jgi:hypothetical protein